jgi:hypothetical protein
MVEMGTDARFLSPGERVVKVTNYHPVVLWPHALGSLAALAFGTWASAQGEGYGTVVILGAIVYLVGAFFDHRLQELVLTDKRLFEVKGIITRTVSTMKLTALTDLRYERSILGLLRVRFVPSPTPSTATSCG